MPPSPNRGLAFRVSDPRLSMFQTIHFSFFIASSSGGPGQLRAHETITEQKCRQKIKKRTRKNEMIPFYFCFQWPPIKWSHEKNTLFPTATLIVSHWIPTKAPPPSNQPTTLKKLMRPDDKTSGLFTSSFFLCILPFIYISIHPRLSYLDSRYTHSAAVSTIMPPLKLSINNQERKCAANPPAWVFLWRTFSRCN